MKVDFQQSEASVTDANALGCITLLLLGVDAYRPLRLDTLRAWVIPAITLRQFRIFYDHRGFPCGFVTWAFLSEDVETCFSNGSGCALHLSEWNEGDRLWIVDFVAKPLFGRAIVSHIRENMFPRFRECKSLRRNVNGSIRRVSTWRRCVEDASS